MFQTFKSLWNKVEKSVAEVAAPPVTPQQQSSAPAPIPTAPDTSRQAQVHDKDQIKVVSGPPTSQSPSSVLSSSPQTSKSFTSLSSSWWSPKNLLSSGGTNVSAPVDFVQPQASLSLSVSSHDNASYLLAGTGLTTRFEANLRKIHYTNIELAARAEDVDKEVIKTIGQCNFLLEAFNYFNEQLDTVPQLANTITKMNRDVESICWRIDELEILLNEKLVTYESHRLNNWKERQTAELAQYRKERNNELDGLEKELQVDLRQKRQKLKMELERQREIERKQREEYQRFLERERQFQAMEQANRPPPIAVIQPSPVTATQPSPISSTEPRSADDADSLLNIASSLSAPQEQLLDFTKAENQTPLAATSAQEPESGQSNPTTKPKEEDEKRDAIEEQTQEVEATGVKVEGGEATEEENGEDGGVTEEKPQPNEETRGVKVEAGEEEEEEEEEATEEKSAQEDVEATQEASAAEEQEGTPTPAAAATTTEGIQEQEPQEESIEATQAETAEE